MDIVSLSLIRGVLGFIYVMALTLFIGNFTQLFSLGNFLFGILLISAVFSIVIGDTIYLLSQNYIGVSQAAPINRTKALFTLFGAYFVLGEPLTEQIFLGVLLVSSGVYLITRPSKDPTSDLDQRKSFKDQSRTIGYVLAILSALAQTIGVIALRMGVVDLDSVTTQSLRYGFAFLVFGLISPWTISVPKIKIYNRQTLKLVAIATIFNVLLGSILWVDSVKYAGASKATMLGSTSTLFALVIAVIFLKESISWKLVLGTLMTIIGIWLLF